VKLLAHFLAESANFGQDGTISVFKGGITLVTASAPLMPTNAALLKFVVVTMLELSANEATSQLHEIQLSITLPDGSLHTGLSQPIATKAPDAGVGRGYANVISGMNVVVAGPGDIRISGTLDGQPLPLLYLQARSPIL
jgi:hypothetical protein